MSAGSELQGSLRGHVVVGQVAAEVGGVVGVHRDPKARVQQPLQRVLGQRPHHPQLQIGQRAHRQRIRSRASRATSAGSSMARMPWSIRRTSRMSSASGRSPAGPSSPAWATASRPRPACANTRRICRAGCRLPRSPARRRRCCRGAPWPAPMWRRRPARRGGAGSRGSARADAEVASPSPERAAMPSTPRPKARPGSGGSADRRRPPCGAPRRRRPQIGGRQIVEVPLGEQHATPA